MDDRSCNETDRSQTTRLIIIMLDAKCPKCGSEDMWVTRHCDCRNELRGRYEVDHYKCYTCGNKTNSEELIKNKKCREIIITETDYDEYKKQKTV
jgi:predicted RNA-binding Zn-ribbon protein involved in translation (DUF1610 family)